MNVGLKVLNKIHNKKIICLLVWFPLACSACYLTQPRAYCPGMTPPTIGWVLSHQALIKKLPLCLPTCQSYAEIFSSLVPSAQICLALCQVDKNQPTHILKNSRNYYFFLLEEGYSGLIVGAKLPVQGSLSSKVSGVLIIFFFRSSCHS